MNSRTKMIAYIHVAKRDLGLNEVNYRALLTGATDKDSLREMSADELKAVIEIMKKHGFKKSKPKRAGTRKMASDDHARLIRALWLSLYHLGEVRDPSEDAMSAYVKRMAKVDDIKWLSPEKEHAVISGLRSWMARAGYIRPTEKDYKYFSFINTRNNANISNGDAIINAAHVLMAQAKIVFKSLKEYTDFLVNEGVVDNDHPYALSAEEIYILIEKLGTKIRALKRKNHG